MPRNPKKNRLRSLKQKECAKRGHNSRRRETNILGDTTNTTPNSPTKRIRILEKEVNHYKNIATNEKRLRLNERRRFLRLQKKAETSKVDVKHAKEEASRLRGVVFMLEKQVETVQKDANESMQRLQERIEGLEEAVKGLRAEQTRLRKRCKRLEAQLLALRQNMQSRLKLAPTTFRMRLRGKYTRELRDLARLLVGAGAAEAKVGRVLRQIAATLGIKLDKELSRRTVHRMVLEGGVAADIQLAYEILATGQLTYSSDSTSHKRIEYECRTIAMKVVDYTDPSAEPTWKLRSLGIDTSVNHTSEVQVDGLKRRLRELADVFNASPLAKREDLRFDPDDFAYRLIGTTGDHAADQKKSHGLLGIWRLDVIIQRLGEEALFKMDVRRVLAFLILKKAKQIERHGGKAAWDALSGEERAGADVEIIREVGREVFDAMPSDERDRLTRFIRTGCCMHKDLNTVKGGSKEMSEMWTNLKKTPPILLANRDNAVVLENRTSTTPTAAEKRAEAISKRGGAHTALLAGLICRNKDKKKGQQNIYNWYMETHVGHRVPFAEVSSTRYASTGEASALIVVYLEHFRNFMVFVIKKKERTGETNIEKNFSRALQDIPTLTELCTLALYYIAISRPYMQYVRAHENLLHLKPFFERKATLLKSLAEDPKIWTGNDISASTGSLSDEGWGSWDLKVIAAVHGLRSVLPDLDHTVQAFARGSFRTFDEKFSDEFKEGGDIDQLTESERDELYFSSTNDINEGGLGSWRQGQARRPGETMDKFNASFLARQNDTASFTAQKLNTDADMLYLMRTARLRDCSQLQKQRKVAQIQADEKKVEENLQKETKRAELQDGKTQALIATSRALILTSPDAELTLQQYFNKRSTTNDILNAQLDYHREIESHLAIPLSKDQVIKCKTGMTNKPERVATLLAAIARYLARGPMNSSLHAAFLTSRGVQSSQATGGSEAQADVEMGASTLDPDYQSDYEDDAV